MPDEDGLPTYEEATGIQRMLPQNISRQISRRMNKDDKAGFCSTGCLFPVFACAPILLLGILMIVIGQPNIFNCPHSWLPIWLVWGGKLIVSFYALCLIYSPLILCNKAMEGAKSIARVIFLIFEAIIVINIYGTIIVGMFWYAAGCYWTWHSVNKMLSINRKIFWYGYRETPKWRVAEKAACRDGPVLWFSFFATIFPFLYVFIACAFCCWRCFRTSGEEGGRSVTNRQEQEMEEGGKE